MDVPALGFDVTHFGHWEGGGHERFTPDQLAFTPVTAAPYFDERCGLLTSLRTLDTDLDTFMSNLATYTPRLYIEQNLSLRGQAQAFLEIISDN
jgi:hypothetical protein